MQTQTNTTELGIALLRVTLGVMFIAHALLKLLVYTLPGTAGFFESVGLPGVLAYVVTPVELLGGIALVAGLKTRWVSLALLPVLIGAASVHAGNGWVFSAPNGGWEYPVYLVIAALAQALLGSGAFALDNSRQIQLPHLGQTA
ncbi:DoxX family protein [Denitromonas ohlonensis]|uniref:DoxX family protein n=2 Tax=Denitromonas TaxID=139331 RepID=A0A557RVH9_9RHOO|nr:DoxX family protein [Denitromonas ohlonensis]TVO69149.1 DoxX family protein [Denitromonas ohlonensis]TVO77249.1 DoxX family protein [Denitromonas ohlonensis]TVT78128.1 MAG: DoxX family protein [Denitromonas halophila]